MSEVNEQYGRLKGAEWFPHLHKKDVIVVGQGGIGSWLSLLLSRVGCNLFIFDHDLYEAHNMSGQFVRQMDIGMSKSETTLALINLFSPDCAVEAFGKYTSQSSTNDIMICGLDNMDARTIAFNNWVKHVETLPDPSKAFFQDGRLLSEQLQIFNIPGDRQDLIEIYSKTHLFADSDVKEQDCTFKQTSHFAAMIASKMVSFLTNWTTNVNGDPYRTVPFFHQYVGVLNMNTDEGSIL